jgi:CRISPR-associated protein Cmr6
MAARGERDSHPGLLLQRYLYNWAAGEQGEPAEKRAVIEAALRSIRRKEIHSLYKTAFERWQKSWPELTAANELQTAGRLIVGLGTENVLETGITLHHTYGLPVLPGSALKGLAAHYCHTVWGETEAKFKKESQYHTLLFGTTDDGGCIIFHDAWFVPDSDPQPLKLDVMTPHHPKWLDGSVPPTDFDSPKPVPFVSVSGRFHIAVSWHGPAHERARNWTEFALSLLRDALFHWGIGGKTSSGYGRFNKEQWEAEEKRRQAEAEQKRIAAEKEAALAAMSPIERSIQEFLEQHPNKTEKRQWFKLLEELKKPDGRFKTPEDRKAVAERVKAGMQTEKVWKDKGKDGERKKFIQDILGEK